MVPASSFWDVDQGGDGVPDSVWVDLGLPVRYTTDGRAYRPLTAILCLDLDQQRVDGLMGRFDSLLQDGRRRLAESSQISEAIAGDVFASRGFTRIVNPVQMEVIEGLNVLVLRGEDTEQLMTLVRSIEGSSRSIDQAREKHNLVVGLPQLAIIPLEGLDWKTAEAILETVLAGEAGMHISSDGRGNIIALATPSQLALIHNVLQQLGSRPNLISDVIKLTRGDAQTALEAIRRQFNGADLETPSATAPQVLADPANRQLIVRATQRNSRRFAIC